jgi:hypothetical protein
MRRAAIWLWLFRLLSVSFLFAAFFHATAFLNGKVEPRMSAAGHALFVVINVVAAFGMWRRPRWFVLFFAVLCVQQLVSHGAWAVAAWQQGWFDWRSWMVLVTMPLMLTALIADAISARRRNAPAAAPPAPARQAS